MVFVLSKSQIHILVLEIENVTESNLQQKIRRKRFKEDQVWEKVRHFALKNCGVTLLDTQKERNYLDRRKVIRFLYNNDQKLEKCESC